MNARAQQQQIQIARRQLGLEDDDYRALLKRVTGLSSSKGMGTQDQRKVLDEFRRLGWESKPKTKGRNWRPESERADIRYIFVLWRLLAEARVVMRGRAALNSFVCGPKFHKKYSEAPTDVNFLSIERSKDVIEALKDMARRNNVAIDQ
ncbi:MAG: regulatory protein GemA [Pseudomonadota bacterium]